jgi:hypothetical protein
MEIVERELMTPKNKGLWKSSPCALPCHLLSAIPASVTIVYGCRGISYVVSTSRTSASQAIGNSFHHLKNGKTRSSRAERTPESTPPSSGALRPCGPCQHETTHPKRQVALLILSWGKGQAL